MTALDPAAWKRTHAGRNGDLLDELATIVPEESDRDLRGPARMHPEAAWNYQRMKADAKADGVRLAVSLSYRTLKKQREKWKAYVGPDGLPKTADDGPNVAAEPGTSPHGWGLALDLNIERRPITDPEYPGPMPGDSTTRFNWLKRHAADYGFHNNDAKSEPWHWDYEGGFPIEEAEMTPEEKAEFDAMKVTIAQHEKLIVALREGLGSDDEPARFEAAGRRLATSVRLTEEER